MFHEMSQAAYSESTKYLNILANPFHAARQGAEYNILYFCRALAYAPRVEASLARKTPDI